MKTKCEQEQTLFNDLRHIEKMSKINPQKHLRDRTPKGNLVRVQDILIVDRSWWIPPQREIWSGIDGSHLEQNYWGGDSKRKKLNFALSKIVPLPTTTTTLAVLGPDGLAASKNVHQNECFFSHIVSPPRQVRPLRGEKLGAANWKWIASLKEKNWEIIYWGVGNKVHTL